MVDKLDVVTTTHPDCGVVLLSDFNRLDICDLLIHQNLKQTVRTPTRGEHVLDLIVTNLHELYNEPSIIAPLGTSDHNVVKWTLSASEGVRLHGKNNSKNMYNASHSLPMLLSVDGATTTPGLQMLRILSHARNWRHPFHNICLQL